MTTSEQQIADEVPDAERHETSNLWLKNLFHSYWKIVLLFLIALGVWGTILSVATTSGLLVQLVRPHLIQNANMQVFKIASSSVRPRIDMLVIGDAEFHNAIKHETASYRRAEQIVINSYDIVDLTRMINAVNIIRRKYRICTIVAQADPLFAANIRQRGASQNIELARYATRDFSLFSKSAIEGFFSLLKRWANVRISPNPLEVDSKRPAKIVGQLSNADGKLRRWMDLANAAKRAKSDIYLIDDRRNIDFSLAEDLVRGFEAIKRNNTVDFLPVQLRFSDIETPLDLSAVDCVTNARSAAGS